MTPLEEKRLQKSDRDGARVHARQKRRAREKDRRNGAAEGRRGRPGESSHQSQHLNGIQPIRCKNRALTQSMRHRLDYV